MEACRFCRSVDHVARQVPGDDTVLDLETVCEDHVDSQLLCQPIGKVGEPATDDGDRVPEPTQGSDEGRGAGCRPYPPADIV